MAGNEASSQKYSRRLWRMVTRPRGAITKRVQMYENFRLKDHALQCENLRSG